MIRVQEIQMTSVAVPFRHRLLELSRLGRIAMLFGALGMSPLLHADIINLSKPVSESIKPDGIYWNFDGADIGQSSPEIVQDHSGNGYDGRLTAGGSHISLPSYIKGRFGTALHVDCTIPVGKDGEAVESTRVPKSSVRWRLRDTPGAWENTKLDMDGKSFTGGVWIKFDEVDPAPSQTIVLFQRGRKDSVWYFRLQKKKGSDWSLHFRQARSTADTSIFSDHDWHHVAFSYDVQPDGSTVTFWLDGVEFGKPVHIKDDPRIPTPDDTDRGFRLGEQHIGSFSTGFTGALDDAFVTSGVHTFKP